MTIDGGLELLNWGDTLRTAREENPNTAPQKQLGPTDGSQTGQFIGKSTQGVSVNQLISATVAEKLSAIDTERYLMKRAARVKMPKF